MNGKYDWGEYKRVERGHSAGDHARCNPSRCRDADQLWQQNEGRLMAIARLHCMAELGIDAREFLGDEYQATVDAASAEFPDYHYLQAEPDSVHRLEAKCEIKLAKLSGAGPPDDRLRLRAQESRRRSAGRSRRPALLALRTADASVAVA